MNIDNEELKVKSLAMPIVAMVVGMLLLGNGIAWLTTVAGLTLANPYIEYQMSTLTLIVLSLGVSGGIVSFVWGYVEFRVRALVNALREGNTGD